jgi:hypothetical protein
MVQQVDGAYCSVFYGAQRVVFMNQTYVFTTSEQTPNTARSP